MAGGTGRAKSAPPYSRTLIRIPCHPQRTDETVSRETIENVKKEGKASPQRIRKTPERGKGKNGKSRDGPGTSDRREAVSAPRDFEKHAQRPSIYVFGIVFGTTRIVTGTSRKYSVSRYSLSKRPTISNCSDCL